MDAVDVYRLRLERARLLEQIDALIEAANAHAAALEKCGASPFAGVEARALAAPLPRTAVDEALSLVNLAALGLDEVLTTRAKGGVSL